MTWPHAFSFERRVPLTRYLPPQPAPPVEPTKRSKRAKRVAPKLPTSPLPTNEGRRAIGFGKTEGMPLWCRAVLAEVAGAHGLKPSVVLGPVRTTKVAEARDEVIYRLKTTKTELAWSRIGRFFGRDHSTAIASFRRHAKRVGEGA